MKYPPSYKRYATHDSVLSYGALTSKCETLARL
jgi:hypothetical protein